LFVAFDGFDGKIAAIAAKANQAISMGKIALNARFVPFLCVADITDRKVEVFCPEERGHCEGLVSA
jgi:hypothetical protein